jgi:DNA polymerase-3 subunit delta'
MNTAAANSLLKLLEEPTPRTLLLLVSEAPARLPATVRSRCRHLRLGPPPADQALSWLRAQAIEGEAADWLALARGAPLAALALAQAEEGDARATVFEALGAMLRAQGSMQACVAACKGVELPRLIDWQIGWCEDLVRLALDGGAERLNHRDLAAELQALGESIDLERLFALRAELIAHRGRLHANLNRGLFLEDQLLSWLRATQGRPITQAGGR